MIYLFLISVLLSGNCAYASSNGTHFEKYDPYWTELSVSWCPDCGGNETNCFKTLPMTAYQALAEGWILISDDCENYGRYNGYRFVFDDDWSVVPIYDRYGFICGIQTNILAEDLFCNSTDFTYSYAHVPYFLKTMNDGDEYRTLTAYFQNPRTVCDSGQSFPDYLDTGLGGEGLWLQYGNSPYVTDFVPAYRPACVEKHWENAQCFGGMGHHNFKYMSKWPHDDCHTVPPYGILFDNDDYMRGFVFMTFGNAQPNCYEHLPADAVKFVMNGENAPDCVHPFIVECGFTTLHVFFTKDPCSFSC